MRFPSGTMLVVCAAAILSTGCVVTPIGAYPAGAYAPGPVVSVAPPPPQVEVYGPPPVVGQIWISGYWNWVGGRHVWVGGRWEAPRPGYYWHPHRWEPVSGGYRMAPGRWDRNPYR